VLLKSIAQSIPTYCMSAFLLPTSFWEEIERMMNSFYWGSKKNRGRSINWLNWYKMTACKDHGGLNFRDLEGFNLAMLGKQGWKLITNSPSLLTIVLKDKYFPRSGFLGANIGHSISFTWRSIRSTILMLSLDYRWKIGDGNDINVWKDPWIRIRQNLRPSSIPSSNLLNMIVYQLFNPTTTTCNRDFIAFIMNTQDTSDICKLPLHSRTHSDTIIWNVSLNGSYTVKSAYKMCSSILDQRTNHHASSDWKLIWSLRVSPKIKHFCWRLLRSCLPMRFNLQSHGVHCQSACVVCNNDLEDEMHMFMHCKFSTDCWNEANFWGKIVSYVMSSGSFSSIMFSILSVLEVDNHARFVAILWSIWRARNACLWEQNSVNAHASYVLAMDTICDCMWCHHLNDDAQSDTPVWSKPQTDWINCNVDCALFKAKRKIWCWHLFSR